MHSDVTIFFLLFELCSASTHTQVIPQKNSFFFFSVLVLKLDNKAAQYGLKKELCLDSCILLQFSAGASPDNNFFFCIIIIIVGAAAAAGPG